MKKVYICFLVVGIMSTSIFAQSTSDKSNSKMMIGVFGGLNIPRLSGGGGNPLSSDWTSRKGDAFGLTFSMDLGYHFALQAEALYSSEGGQRNGNQAFGANPYYPAVGGSYLYATINNESILNYAEIPVMLKYNVPVFKSLSFYIDFGPYVGFLLNAKQKTSGNSKIYLDQQETQPLTPLAQSFNANTNITSSINTFNFGLTGGIGFSQGIGVGKIFLDARGAYGLISIQKHSSDGSNNTGNLLIDIGYSIPL
jgi:hypothetical protein